MPAASKSNPAAKIHISLNVSNIERSVAFYEGFFGTPAHKRRPDYANFDLSSPPLKLALQEKLTPAEAISSGQGSLSAAPVSLGALNHLGIQVATREEVNAARQRLIDAGLATFDEGDTECCYARQDKVWAHDPDGNGWEVYVLLDDRLQEEDPGAHDQERECAAVCCTAELP